MAGKGRKYTALFCALVSSVAISARCQNECPAGSVVFQQSRDASDIVHQTGCINTGTGRVTYPFLDSLTVNTVSGNVKFLLNIDAGQEAYSRYIASDPSVLGPACGGSGGQMSASSNLGPPLEGYLLSNWCYVSGDIRARTGGGDLIQFESGTSASGFNPGDMAFFTAPSAAAGTSYNSGAGQWVLQMLIAGAGGITLYPTIISQAPPGSVDSKYRFIRDSSNFGEIGYNRTSYQGLYLQNTNGGSPGPTLINPAGGNVGVKVTGAPNEALQVGGAIDSSVNTVAFSATPTFDGSLGNTQELTLTGNVTSSTLTNAAAGETLNFIICQDATGGRTFVWPSSVHGPMTVGITASKCSAQSFIFDGTSAFALGAGSTNE